MTDQFSDGETPPEEEFQQSSDKFFLNFCDFRFGRPNPGNSYHQHSMQNIPLSNFSNTSLPQLPPPPLPPPPPPPQLCTSNFNVKNEFPSQNFTRIPPSNHPPPRPQPYTASEFFPSSRQPNLQTPYYSKPPPPFCHPPPQGLIRQPPYEIKKSYQPNADQVTSVNKTTENLPVKEILAVKSEDKFWVQSWMTNAKKRLYAEDTVKKTKEVKISDVQKKLLTYATSLKELKDLLSNLSVPSAKSEGIEQQQRDLVSKAHKLKVKIEELRSYFADEENTRKIEEILEKRREKRIKRRKTNGERNARKRRRKEEWKKREEEMDFVIRRENEEEKQKLEEEKMKREADSILREVRTKQEDVVRMEKLLQALSDLREIRKKKGDIHGYVENTKASAFFDKMKKEFESVLSDQQKIYSAEEQTLKIMIQESQSSTIFSKKVGSQFAPNLNEVKNDIYQIYFGRKRERTEALKEYERSFLAAEESSEILVQRRKDWDQFIVGDNSSGSSVPIGWVLANVNPNGDWKSYQES